MLELHSKAMLDNFDQFFKARSFPWSATFTPSNWSSGGLFILRERDTKNTVCSQQRDKSLQSDLIPLEFINKQFAQQPQEPVWTHPQNLMIACTLSNIILDHFEGNSLKSLLWCTFFIQFFSSAHIMTQFRIENSVTNKAKDLYKEALQALSERTRYEQVTHTSDSYTKNGMSTKWIIPAACRCCNFGYSVEIFWVPRFESDLKARVIAKSAWTIWRHHLSFPEINLQGIRK